VRVVFGGVTPGGEFPDQDGTGRLRECPPARIALPPPLFRADGQSHPGPAPLARCSRNTGGARTLCPVAAGGARSGRLCVNGWKNRLGAGARSAFVSCSPCMAERSGLRARSELHGAGPEPIFPAKSEWSSFSCEWRPSCMSPYRAPPAATPAHHARERTFAQAASPVLVRHSRNSARSYPTARRATARPATRSSIGICPGAELLSPTPNVIADPNVQPHRRVIAPRGPIDMLTTGIRN
jgi:hypothetical protein